MTGNRRRLDVVRDISHEELTELYERVSGLIRIKKNMLDDELEVQSAHFLEVTKAQALAMSYRDGAKIEMERTEAEVDLEARQAATAAQVKITEGGIRATVMLDARVMAAHAKFSKWVLLHAELTGLKESFSQRSYAIKDLAGLWIAGYWNNGSAGQERRSRSEAEADAVRATHREARARRAQEER